MMHDFDYIPYSERRYLDSGYIFMREREREREKEREGGRMGERERDILPLYHLYLGIDTPVGRT